MRQPIVLRFSECLQSGRLGFAQTVETDIGAFEPVVKRGSEAADSSMMTSAEEGSDLAVSGAGGQS